MADASEECALPRVTQEGRENPKINKHERS